MFHLPLLTQLDVLITPMSLISETVRKGSSGSGHQVGVGYHVSILNTSDSTVRIMGKKWIVKDAKGRTLIYESDQVFSTKPLLYPGQIFAFDGVQDLLLPAKLQLVFLVRDEQGLLYHTDPVSLFFNHR